MYIIIISPKTLVKTIKNVLEENKILDKRQKIVPLLPEREREYIIEDGTIEKLNRRIIPTTVELNGLDHYAPKSLKARKSDIIQRLHLEHYKSDISLAVPAPKPPEQTTSSEPETASSKGQLARTIQQWLLSLPSDLRASLPVSISHLISLYSWPYTIYPPLLLLPPTIFTTPPWPALLKTSLSQHLSFLYQLLCSNFCISHIAINAPIPLASQIDDSHLNILRSPSSLAPLYGSFGPIHPLSYEPKSLDFAEAFWCGTRQHGIYQTWAPRYTMFSRGNVSEKHRIMTMPELRKKTLGNEPEYCSAVDLYAGIGYFAFCYAKAGLGKVVCWELNGWSVEGLRRGAEKNGWSVEVVKSSQVEGKLVRSTYEQGGKERLVVFQEDNCRASEKVERMRRRIPPVRHVNCGFLPSSKDSWKTAVEVLDPIDGGWIHAHENIAFKDIEIRRAEIVGIFAGMTNSDAGKPKWTVECQHLQCVKTYAPGIMHCVLDIFIAPMSMSTSTGPGS
ncbi:hypothetical protein MMC06_002712 [Schaereria dolodes]|nr:hypothetical protein [Schaereria dolodes]